MNKTKYTIHQLRNPDPDDDWLGYAIIPDDETQGYLIGDAETVALLAKCLNKFVETQKHDGVIDDRDERLGWQWLDISDAVKLSASVGMPISAPSIRNACAAGKIYGAQLDGKTWRFPQTRFLGWLQFKTRYAKS